MRIIFLFIFVFLISCNQENNSKKEHSLHWHKNSGEYVALCHQAFNIAKLKLDNAINKNYSKKLAVVIDIDETILNNTPYNEMLIDSSKTFNQKSWSKWVNKKIATPVPGSLKFLNYAELMGVELIYLSNSKIENYNPTMENLISAGFPFDDKTIMLLRDENTEKTSRRNSLSDYEIILMLGDNLSDFSSIFENKSNIERTKSVDSLSNMFGDKFIIIPNLIYGDWDFDFK